MEKSKVIENLKYVERYMGMPEQGCKWTPNASTIAIEEAINSLEKLSRYEATGLEPEEILTGVQLAEIACLQIRYKKRQEPLTQHELQEMAGKPVYCPEIESYGIVKCETIGTWAGVPFLVCLAL